jgi:hypothetical protein
VQGWLADWLAGWLADWLAGRLAGWLAGRPPAGWQKTNYPLDWHPLLLPPPAPLLLPARLPACSDMRVSHEIAKSLNSLFGGIDLDPTGGWVGGRP